MLLKSTKNAALAALTALLVCALDGTLFHARAQGLDAESLSARLQKLAKPRLEFGYFEDVLTLAKHGLNHENPDIAEASLEFFEKKFFGWCNESSESILDSVLFIPDTLPTLSYEKVLAWHDIILIEVLRNASTRLYFDHALFLSTTEQTRAAIQLLVAISTDMNRVANVLAVLRSTPTSILRKLQEDLIDALGAIYLDDRHADLVPILVEIKARAGIDYLGSDALMMIESSGSTPALRDAAALAIAEFALPVGVKLKEYLLKDENIGKLSPYAEFKVFLLVDPDHDESFAILEDYLTSAVAGESEQRRMVEQLMLYRDKFTGSRLRKIDAVVARYGVGHSVQNQSDVRLSSQGELAKKATELTPPKDDRDVSSQTVKEVKRLVTDLRGNNIRERDFAVLQLANKKTLLPYVAKEFATQEDLRFLFELIFSMDLSIAFQTCSILGMMGDRANAVMPGLIAILTDSANPKRRVAAKCIADISDYITLNNATFLSFASDLLKACHDEETSEFAVHVIGNLAPFRQAGLSKTQDRDLLLKLLSFEQSSFSLIVEVQHALQKFAEYEYESASEYLLAANDQNYVKRAAAIHSLGHIGLKSIAIPDLPKIVATLKSALKDNDYRVRMRAAHSLGVLATHPHAYRPEVETSLFDLVSMIQSTDTMLISEVLLALEKFGERSYHYLDLWSQDLLRANVNASREHPPTTPMDPLQLNQLLSKKFFRDFVYSKSKTAPVEMRAFYRVLAYKASQLEQR